MGFGNQLLVLSWKNFTLRKRKPVRLFVEILLPLCLFLFLVFDRFQFNKDLRIFQQECHYNPRAMPSAGTIPFLQSYICELDNECNNNYFKSKPGIVNYYNSSVIATAFNFVEELLAENTGTAFSNNLDGDLKLLRDVTSLLKSQPDLLGNLIPLNQSMDLGGLKKLVPNKSEQPSSGRFQKTDIRSNINQIQKLLQMAANWMQGSKDNLQSVDNALEGVCDNQLFQNLLQLSTLGEKNICDQESGNRTALLKDLMSKLNTTGPSSEAIKQLLERITEPTAFSSLSGLLQVMNDVKGSPSMMALYGSLQALLGDAASAKDSFQWHNFFRHLFCAVEKAVPQPDVTVDKEQLEPNNGSTKPHVDLQVMEALFDVLKAYKKPSQPQTCANFFAALDSNSATRPFWHQIRTVALGVIPYAPASPAAQEIIREASRTFDSIQAFQEMASTLSTVMPSIMSILEDNKDYLEALFGIDFFKSVVDDSKYTWANALNDTASLLSSASSFLSCFPLNKFVPYPDEDSLVNASVKLHTNRTFWAGIVFDNINSSTIEVPTTVKYRIRMQHYRVDRTTYIEDQYWHPGPRDYPPTDLRYFLYGFIYIQDMIEHAIIRLQTNTSQEPGVYTQQMPYPCWTFDRFVFVVSWNLPLFVVVSWIYSVAMIIKGIVYEKEMRLKEVMKMMGLSNGIHWVAWFINAFVTMLITICALCLILKYGKILEYSDPSIVFVFLLAYVMSTISLCFLISVFFNKANLAAVCGGIIFFILFLPYTQLVQWEEIMSRSAKIASSLLSNIAMGYGCHYIALHEAQAMGIQWHNIDKSPLPDDNFNLQTCICMMFLDAFIYLILTWYIEAVFPGQYGMPRKWYFPFQKSYWLGWSSKRVEVNALPIEDIRHNSPNFEEEPPGSVIGVKVRNLRKVYKGGKVAVDGLSINFCENQITSFLGHNGAGKTTTMSILTGLFPPTSGTAYIYGKNVLTSMDEIRHDLGMCPQHNVLFDLLTVEEHIWFYSRLKGRTEAEIKVELTQMIQDVGLPHKQKEKSKNLSGGMKRKLSVAIAFVGGSKTVILDEPTAGVDPYARRAIWELLLKLKKGRTIILSTHHMDEADVLGDRIAIISQGRVRTVGSSMFLKERFGNGYYLTFAKQEGFQELGAVQENSRERSRSLSASAYGQFSTTAVVHRDETDMHDLDPSHPESDGEDEGFDERGSREASTSSFPKDLHGNAQTGFSLPKLTSFIKQLVPNAELVEDNSMEVCFRLPERCDDDVKLENLFEALEKSHTDMGISSYGISDTSLEEVFIKITEEDDDELIDIILNSQSFDEESEQLLTLDDGNDNIDEEEDFSEAGDRKVQGKLLKAWQVIALIIKRFHHVRRSKKGFLSEIILPSAIVCIAMIISNIWPPLSEMPPLELQPWMYEPRTGSDSSLNVFYSNDNPYNELANILEAEFLQSPFYGTRCMNPHQHSIEGKPCLERSQVNSVWTHVRSNISHPSPTCSCRSGFQQCPKGAAGPKPSQCELLTNDNLLNMTARNLTDWLVKTKDKYLKRRYGGFSFGQESIFGRLNASQISDVISPLIKAAKSNGSILYGSENLWKDMEAVLKSAFVQDNAKVWFNNVGWAASVSYMNGLNNLILRSLLPSEKDPKDYGIVAVNHPLNVHRNHFEEKKMDWVDFTVSMCIIFALSFVPASFVLFLIEERVSNSKHLQFLSGINPSIYWLANSLWDYMNYTIPALICILILLAFGNEAYTSAKHFPCLLALLLLYGWAINPMMYPFSRVFNVASSAFVALSCFNMFVGFFTTIVTFILDFFQQEDEDLLHLNNIFKKVFLIFPHYCLGRGLLDLSSLKLQSDFYARYDEKFEYNLYDWNVIGRNIFAMAMMGVLFVIFNLLIEYKFFLSGLFASKAPLSNAKNEDIDVAKERQRVSSGGAANDILRLEGLTKTYRAPSRKEKLTAVDHLYVGVPKGQCFGLLGVNGAGKTTTFKMLTGDVNVSDGDAYVNQYSISKDMIKASEHIGYCPQFDALDPLLTAREILEFYARVRGVSPSQVKRTADWAVRKLGLLPHADKMSCNCSGGNKRKLSTAIALIGNPSLIFLDEPTTGMDPKAKRFLWDRINNIVKAGHSVILTSHSMEECEALCSRLAIMVNGSFQCIGSIQHLKNRFGSGYSIKLRVAGSLSDLTPIMEFITSCFPSAELIEKHHNMLQYQLGTEGLSLSRLFHGMEEAKEKYDVESYSVSQTTLDQVFINFAKKQTDMLDYELLEDFDDNAFHIEANAGPSCHEYSPDNVCEDEESDFDDQSLAGSTIQLIQPSRRQRENSHSELISFDDLQSNSIL